MNPISKGFTPFNPFLLVKYSASHNINPIFHLILLALHSFDLLLMNKKTKHRHCWSYSSLVMLKIWCIGQLEFEGYVIKLNLSGYNLENCGFSKCCKPQFQVLWILQPSYFSVDWAHRANEWQERLQLYNRLSSNSTQWSTWFLPLRQPPPILNVVFVPERNIKIQQTPAECLDMVVECLPSTVAA